MKKLFVVLAILFIGILLAGCTSQPAAPVATPTPTPVPTTVVKTTVATPVPTKEVVVVVVNTTVATPTPTPTPIPTYVITFSQDLTVVPDATAYIKVGTKVVWKNDDPWKPHCIQANDIQTGAYFGTMEAVTIPYGQSISVIFDKPGAYDYTTGPFQPQTQAKIVVK